MRRSTDRLYPPPKLTPREREAAEIVAQRPGMTIAELRAELGVGPKRIWQIIFMLERTGAIRRDGDPPKRQLRPRP